MLNKTRSHLMDRNYLYTLQLLNLDTEGRLIIALILGFLPIFWIVVGNAHTMYGHVIKLCKQN